MLSLLLEKNGESCTMTSILAASTRFIATSAQAVASRFSSPAKEPQKPQAIAKADVGYSAFSLFLESGKSQLKSYCKLGNYGSFWVNRALAQPSSALAGFGKDMGHFKNCASIFDVFNKTPKLAQQVAEACAAPSLSAGGSVVVQSCDLFNSCADVAGAVNTYIPIDCIRTIANVNAGATLLFAASKIKGTIPKLLNAATSEQKLFYVMKIVTDLAYVAFGIMSLTALAMGTAAPVPALITCLTIGTVLGLTNFFYEKVYDPEKKNESVDFAALKPRLQLA